MKKSSNYIKLEFLSRSTNEGFARSAAASFAAQLDPTLDELGDVKTAVSEAVTNAIVHAYPDALGKVELKLRLYPENEFEVVVRDWGVGIENIDRAGDQGLTEALIGLFIEERNAARAARRTQIRPDLSTFPRSRTPM